ncbi:IS66 family insertion sequence element accessory protein TnpB [bacterium]|nr:IS66 family insertion sequence element accessory protein TnpB [bacterium]
MFNFTAQKMYFANELVDMRKSFDTLADYVQFHMEHDPRNGDAYIFIGKRRNRMKILIWEDSGFWICNKRLEQGTFSKQIVKLQSGKSTCISPSQLCNLLEGIIVFSSRKLKRFHMRKTA